MLHINCPHCGMRSQNEFSYGGDASVKRPELNKEVSDQDWDNFVYNRKSLRGKHLFFFKQKTAYEMLRSLVGSEMCIRDRS